MVKDHDHITCSSCGETVRTDRVNAQGVCVNCIALGTKPEPVGAPLAAPDEEE